MVDRRKPLTLKPFERVDIIPEEIVDISPRTRLHIINAGNVQMTRVVTIFSRGNTDILPDNTPDTLPHYAAAAVIMADMLLAGSTKSSGDDIAEAIDYSGGWIMQKSHTYDTRVTIFGMNDKIPDLLNIAYDSICNATFDADRLECIKIQTAQKMRLDLQRPQYTASKALSAILYGHADPRSSALAPQHIETITRDAVLHAHHAVTRNSDLDIYVGGGITPEVLKSVTTYATLLDKNLEANVPRYNFPAIAPEAPGLTSLQTPANGQCAISAAIPVSITRHDTDYIPLRNVCIALGGYFGSRLMTNIREEKGLTYGIQGNLNGASDMTYLGINAMCNAEKAPLVIDEIRNEISRLATEPMHDDEFQRLRNFLASQLLSTLDTPFSILDHYTMIHSLNAPEDYYTRQFDVLAAMTPETLRNITAHYLNPDNLRIVTAG